MREPTTVTGNSRGFTLVEVLVAIVVLIFGLMTLFTAVMMSMNKNVENNISDAVVRLAEERMDDIRNTSPLPAPDPTWACASRTLSLGSITVNPNVCDRIIAAGTMRQIEVVVGWDYGPSAPAKTPTNRKFQHSTTSIVPAQ